MQRTVTESNGQGAEQMPFPERNERNERRQERGFGVPDSSGYGAPQADNTVEQARRAARMSPEDRRALRRQIDEAGHDLYVPKHR